jgi:hypothetical protein
VRAQLQGFNCFEAFFTPIDRWQDVTTYPWRRGTPDAELKQALRTKFAQLAKPSPGWCDVCAHCGATGPLDYDHVQPTFDEIAHACLVLLSPEERSTRFGYDKFAPDTLSVADFMPDHHPVVRALLVAHETNVWQWLCRPCHLVKSAADNRARRARAS